MESAASGSAGRPARKRNDVIIVDKLRSAYGDRVILNEVSFTVAEGETLVVLGPSGCGKSTLLRTLIGLLKPRGGSIRILGEDVVNLPERELDAVRRKMGVAFQNSALLGSLTIGENVSLPLREHTSLDAATIRIMTRLKLEQVGLGGYEEFLPAQLSGGMRKRAGIARAISMDPKCLFLDEPSAGLDPITAAGLDDLLLKLKSALGLTMVVVTHELDSAFRVADRMIMLDKGHVLLEGTTEEMRSSELPRVRQFFDRQPDHGPSEAGQLLKDLTQ